MGKAKCKNEDCPLKEECFRFQSEPNDYQWWAQFEFKDGVCDGFIELKNN